MINRVEVLNFRCLRYIDQPVASFHVLVGPNASGKTTFLDTISFLGKLISEGVDEAIADRTENFEDLLWNHKGEAFEIAVEATIPDDRKANLRRRDFSTIRYEIRIGYISDTREVGILQERILLKPQEILHPKPRLLFPEEPVPPVSILTDKQAPGARTILSKIIGGNDNFYSEVHEISGKGWYPSIRLGPHKSTLANLHEDESRFPASTWLKALLGRGIESLVLNSVLIRKASPPGRARGFLPDGSNLPWVVHDLSKHPKRYKAWIAHVQTALPDIVEIRSVERPDDKHRYIKICYKGGLEVPSWMASDGTLRLLTLTILAYIPDFKGIYLVEEPENGIHPSAVETVYQSLSSVYDAQILLATHSPVILGLADLDKLLCFKKSQSGAVDIVSGNDHPALKGWKGEINLGVLFAGGVLG